MTFEASVEAYLAYVRSCFPSATEDTLISGAELHGLCDDSGKEFSRESPFGVVVASPDLSDADQRAYLQGLALKYRAFRIFVSQEAWSATVQEGDKEGERIIMAAHAAGKLQTVPKKYLSEVVRVFAEDAEVPTRCWAATISRGDSGERSLGEWDERELTLPRPNFRRYLPEHTASGALRIGLGE